MKFNLLFVILTIIKFVSSQTLEGNCEMPLDIQSSRQTRLHHPCESNQNRDFAITTHSDFYCIFYSAFGIALFGAESKFEIKIDGDWNYEQSGAENFELDNKTMKFSATMDDVKILIRKRGEKMPRITSVIVEDGSLPDAQVTRQEYCSCEGCGYQDEAIAVILGGVEARTGAWPWNSAIYYKPSITNLQFRCGATIINTRTLITIATCLYTDGKQIGPEKLVVAVKETTLYGASSKKLNVRQIKTHENFTQDDSTLNRLKYDNNIGLLITEAEIPFSLHVNAICLPESDQFSFENKKGFVVGWGFNKDYQLSQKLQQLEVPTFKFLDCFYRNRELFSGYASKRNFCAGYQNNRGICSGDSGGGLYIKIGKKFFLYGLASFSNCKCVKETQKCEIYDEGIFVNLASYIQWIHNNMY